MPGIPVDMPYTNHVGLRLKWPPNLTHLELESLCDSGGYCSQLQYVQLGRKQLNSAVATINEAKLAFAKDPSSSSSATSSLAAQLYRDVINDPSVTPCFKRFLCLPDSVETLICSLHADVPPFLMPPNLRIFRNCGEVFAPPKTIDSWHSFFLGTLRDVEIGSWRMKDRFPGITASTLRDFPTAPLSGLSVCLDSKFKIEDLSLIPDTLERLTIVGVLKSSQAFNLPSHLKTLRINIYKGSKVLPLLPRNLETFLALENTHLSPDIVFPPSLRTLMVDIPMDPLFSLARLPQGLTKLDIHLSAELVKLENFNPRFLPPILRDLSVTIVPDEPTDAWFEWWAHVPHDLPLESLAFHAPVALPVPFNPALPPDLDKEFTDNLAAATLHLPYLQRSITRLQMSFSVDDRQATLLASYFAKNLPLNLTALAFFISPSTPTETVRLPVELLPKSGSLLSNFATKSWDNREVRRWCTSGNDRYGVRQYNNTFWEDPRAE